MIANPCRTPSSCQRKLARMEEGGPDGPPEPHSPRLDNRPDKGDGYPPFFSQRGAVYLLQ